MKNHSKQSKSTSLNQVSYPYRSKTQPTQYMVVASLNGNSFEPEPIIEQDGVEYELTDRVEIDVNLIPDYVRDRLAEATLQFVKEYLQVPGNREKLNAKVEELRTNGRLHNKS